MRNFLACSLAGLFFALAQSAAGQPYLLRDINQVPPDSGRDPVSSSPEAVGVVPGAVLFRTYLAANEPNLWMSDGTAAGTKPLPLGSSSVYLLGTAEGRLVFGQSGFPGAAVWASDGTPAGTTRLTFHESYGHVNAVGSLPSPGRLLFWLGVPGGASALWATDGTLAGTRVVREIERGPAGSVPRPGALAGATLLFPAASATAGLELWRTDGSTQGTALVADLRPGPDSSNPRSFVSFGDRVLFIADDGVTGAELWVSDGTPAGTSRVSDLTPGAEGTTFQAGPLVHPSGLVAFFAADRGPGPQVWRTDGTAAGTASLTAPFAPGADWGPLLLYNGRLLFVAWEEAFGSEPWVSDGTAVGTRRIDLCPGACSSFTHSLAPAVTSRGVVFGGDVPGWGYEPFLSDATEDGTLRLDDLCPGDCDGYAGFAGEASGRLILQGGDFQVESLWASEGVAGDARLLLQRGQFQPGIGSALGSVGDWLLLNIRDEEHGFEPWRTDGTPEGTELLADLGRGNESSNPAQFHRLGDAEIFTALQGDYLGLWRTDGTIAGTEPVVAELFQAPHAGGGDERFLDLEVAGDRLFVLADTGTVRTLWSTDGTPGGTVRVLQLPDEPPPGSTFHLLSPFGDEVLLLGSDLWRVGAAPGSGRRLAEIWCTTGAARTGTRVVFGASEIPGAASNREPWVTDGTAAGTRRLKNIREGSSDPGSPLAFNGLVYFAATDDAHGRELWRTDGTEAGTRLFLDLVPGAASSSPQPLAVLGGRMLFSTTGPGGSRLWATDGTSPGTIGLADYGPSGALILRGALFWWNTEGELWRSNGTPAGTFRLPDLLPDGVVFQSRTPVGDLLALTVENHFGDAEIWLSDGTPGGTWRAVGDGSGLTSIAPRAVLGDALLFSGADPEIGTELWAVHLGDRPGPFGPPEVPSGLRAEPASATAVRVTWRDHATDETRFRLSVRTPHGPAGGPLLHPPDTAEAIVGGLTPGVPMTVRVRAENGLGSSPWSEEASATPEAIPPGPCTAGGDTLCLLDDRFALQVTWRDQRSGDVGIGRATPYPGSDRTGTFWFFDSANVELIAKALDGRPVNGAFWSFFGGLSDIEYWVTVTDTVDRRSRTYRNAPGEICGVGDTTAFPEAGSGALRAAAVASAPLPGATGRPAPATPMPRPGTAGACQPGPETLCLLDGRLKVEVDWKNQRDGGSGPGRAVAGTGKTGYFWFFSPSNVELVVKALDGTPVNGHLWVFWGALTDVEYTITVTDTETGAPVEYHNPPGEICGGADTAAF